MMETLELLHIYQYVLGLSNEVQYLSVYQRVAKMQMIKVFMATYFTILCSESLLIGDL